MNLSNLKPAKGSIKKVKRIGRGQGSGHGGTSTRGNNGAGQRSGAKHKRGFEGGQMPLQRRVPKFGFKNINRVEYVTINLDDIQTYIDAGKIKGTKIDKEFLLTNKLIKGKNKPLKVLGNGEIKTTLEITANAFSKTAKDKIEKGGGKAVVV